MNVYKEKTDTVLIVDDWFLLRQIDKGIEPNKDEMIYPIRVNRDTSLEKPWGITIGYILDECERMDI